MVSRTRVESSKKVRAEKLLKLVREARKDPGFMKFVHEFVNYHTGKSD